MDNNDNDPQQPENPNGLMQNQMMQLLLNSLQMNQMAGMQWNGPGAPQMQPNLPMFPNPYPAMGGMPQQFLGGMPQQFLGGMPQQFLNPFQPQFGNQMMPHCFPPPGQMPMMPPDQLMMMMMMGGQMPQMAQNPMMQYMPQYMVPQPAIYVLPMSTPMPVPIIIKKEVADDKDSIIECTPDSVPQPKFSIANILNQREVKKEPVDEEDPILPNTTSNLSPTRPVTNSDSSNPPNMFPSPFLPTGFMTLDKIPDTPASPDNQYDNQKGERNGSSPHEELQKNFVGCDEYLSSDETMNDRVEEPLIVPPHQSRWERESTREKSLDNESTFTCQEWPKIKEEITDDEDMSEKETEDACQINSREIISHTTHDSSKPLFYMNPTPHESPRRPSIPKRFPVRTNESIENIDRIEKPQEEKTSPWRMTKSPVRRIRRDDSEESVERKKRRVNAYSVLVDGLPSSADEERIERYFNDRYGRCRVTRVYGDLSKVRIEFKSRRDRDYAYSHRTVVVSSHKLSIHEDFTNERSESREEAGPSRSYRRHSPIRVDSNEDIDVMGNDTQLERYEMECERGYPRKENLLNAGPIPKECNITSVIKYFRREACATVFDVPYPTHLPHEYLILRFSNISDAKRILAQPAHIVDGHDIPVSPPCDVYLQLNGLAGLEKEAMMTIQEECGVLINYPIVHKGTMYRGACNMFGYVTFGRPQDAQDAIDIGLFNVDGRPFRVANSDRNYSFKPYKELWEVKSKLAEMSKNEYKKKIKKEKKNCLKDALITDYHIPILTIGPIPDHCTKECDQYLLRNFNNVHEIPFEMKDRNFRIIAIDDSDTMVEMLSEGYVRVGKNEERVLVSPSFDVVFKSDNSKSIDMKQLIPYLQRNYGPIVRRPYLKQYKARLTFGRIKDALKAIEDSPHFKSMMVIGEPAVPNLSYHHFQKIMNLELYLDRANEADRLEEAANIRVDCRMNEEKPRTGKRRHSVIGENSSESINEDEKEKEEVLVCSPVKKNDNPEERSVRVRVCDDDQWLPLKEALLKHFQQFGNVTAVNFADHLEGIIQFSNLEETTMVLKSKYTKIGGVWISILPYSQTDNQ